ncbi:uncharacterized protein LOC116302699 [Actinia tenebrosa]|uniref:Uncharacterized protein LOC116302699 n=1 Tax=Actinia tenebrosa TaxID=6105 RepID=A0A6P8IM56_ACTTE|nr:uncharacterized protein LOC116302699 [Actinia tenebrosa]XP_031567914.1 uncharacterized protein LOC116302699 [Actinia tenebrosa]
MAIKEKVFWIAIPMFISAVLLTIAVIAIAIYFQKLRKTIEAEIKAETQKVDKKTVKRRRKENKYSKSKKGSEDCEPEFYDSPPMRDEHREHLQLKTFQKQIRNEDDYNQCLSQTSSRDHITQLAASRKVSRHAETMPRTLMKQDSYIEFIGDEVALQTMETFQSTKVASKGEHATQAQLKYKSHATSLGRAGIGNECNRSVEPNTRSSNLRGATLPHTSSPIKKDPGYGFKGAFRDIVPQQQVSRKTNPTSKNGHDDREMCEVMENNSEMYENTGYMSDSTEDVYENQEIIEQEDKRRSQNLNMPQVPQHQRNWNSQTVPYHKDNCKMELYENQAIVDQVRKLGHGQHDGDHFELYENYIHEEMYENC